MPCVSGVITSRVVSRSYAGFDGRSSASKDSTSAKSVTVLPEMAFPPTAEAALPTPPQQTTVLRWATAARGAIASHRSSPRPRASGTRQTRRGRRAAPCDAQLLGRSVE
eukprot:CAMPEP_0180396806 /NCGR_PEP_ID=MMETSP0989-20121125/35670_1 /TAXON_ID=697907 /ORGANISM="non described non described, Strain CCMP2293" /LENGTH=108 /DNA_ID=CAMNT_0022399163 /DNA_START=119 /DNA_END=446 /DNA_ORIENTATION=-